MSLLVYLNRVDEWPAVAELGGRVERAARSALLASGPTVGEVSFTFVSLPEMQELNRQWLGRDWPTDVIAFELGGGSEVVGDVYISPEMARTSAEERTDSEGREILRLVIHGALHVIGMNHPEGDDRETSEMFVTQEELLEALGYD